MTGLAAPKHRDPEPAGTDSSTTDACGAPSRSSAAAARRKRIGAVAPLDS